MKYIGYIFVAAASLLCLSCEKHEIVYHGYKDVTGDVAMFKITYCAPLRRIDANYVDSVYVNGAYVTGSNSDGGQLQVRGTLPSGAGYAAGAYYLVPAGSVNIRFFKNGATVYDQNVTLAKGYYNLFVHDLNAAPVAIENEWSYLSNPDSDATAETFDTDSTANVRFFNFAYSGDGVPYPGRLQYQWCPYNAAPDRSPEKDEEGNYIWRDLGEPVAFGESTEVCSIVVRKNVYNSSGYNYVRFRVVDADTGEWVPQFNAESDYWTLYLGRGYDHFFYGRTDFAKSADANAANSIVSQVYTINER